MECMYYGPSASPIINQYRKSDRVKINYPLYPKNIKKERDKKKRKKKGKSYFKVVPTNTIPYPSMTFLFFPLRNFLSQPLKLFFAVQL